MPGSRLHRAHGRLARRGRGDDLEGARCARSEARLDLLIALPGLIVGRYHLDRGHPGAHREHRKGQRQQRRQGEATEHVRPPPEQLAPAGEARRAMLAAVHPGKRQAVDPGSELGEHRGQQRQRRGQHEEDRDDDAQGRRAEGGARHEHHRRERDQHGQPREEDGLAGRVHRRRHRLDGTEPLAEVGAPESNDDEEGVVDAQRKGEHQREVHRPDRDRRDQRSEEEQARGGDQARRWSASAAGPRPPASRRPAPGSPWSPARR